MGIAGGADPFFEVTLAAVPEAVLRFLGEPDRFVSFIPGRWGAGNGAWTATVKLEACVEIDARVLRATLDQRALWSCFWSFGEPAFLSQHAQRHRHLRLETRSRGGTRILLRDRGCGLCQTQPLAPALHGLGSPVSDLSHTPQRLGSPEAASSDPRS
jgi:hypothetical protein